MISWREFWLTAREDPVMKRRVLDNVAVIVFALGSAILATGILIVVLVR